MEQRVQLSQYIICAFSSRANGNTSLNYGDTRDSLLNRSRFLSTLGIDHRDLVCAKQVHGGHVHYARQQDRGRGAISYDSALPDTDAFVTDKKNLPLAIFTADFLSIFLYDPKAAAIGVVHAGWKSAKENIVANAILLMRDNFNSKVPDIRVTFGPAIRECCYEVGEEFHGFFPKGVISRQGRNYLNIAAVNTEQLLSSGIDRSNIIDSGICTSCQNEKFFSFRKEGESCGRLMSVAMLR